MPYPYDDNSNVMRFGREEKKLLEDIANNLAMMNETLQQIWSALETR